MKEFILDLVYDKMYHGLLLGSIIAFPINYFLFDLHAASIGLIVSFLFFTIFTIIIHITNI